MGRGVVDPPRADSSFSAVTQEDDGKEGAVELGQVNVSAGDAIAAAENETEGTVVELELFAAEVERTPVWTVEFLLDDGSEREVFVDATDGTVLGVRTDEHDRDDFDDDD
ncbi:PepSY domain-containing protein [Halobacteriaceae archaeon GCM10025711]